ncbi:MAG TPA: hypothetical protein VFP34_07385 [Microlunatus sp.]|nr:hypothetical protein [Microlunatus sp.]
MNKSKLTRRIVAATASAALAVGIFAAAPLSADAAKKTNYSFSKISTVRPTLHSMGSTVNGV